MALSTYVIMLVVPTKHSRRKIRGCLSRDPDASAEKTTLKYGDEKGAATNEATQKEPRIRHEAQGDTHQQPDPQGYRFGTKNGAESR
jgi:hypothetical protein